MERKQQRARKFKLRDYTLPYPNEQIETTSCPWKVTRCNSLGVAHYHRPPKKTGGARRADEKAAKKDGIKKPPILCQDEKCTKHDHRHDLDQSVQLSEAAPRTDISKSNPPDYKTKSQALHAHVAELDEQCSSLTFSDDEMSDSELEEKDLSNHIHPTLNVGVPSSPVLLPLVAIQKVFASPALPSVTDSSPSTVALATPASAVTILASPECKEVASPDADSPALIPRDQFTVDERGNVNTGVDVDLNEVSTHRVLTHQPTYLYGWVVAGVFATLSLLSLYCFTVSTPEYPFKHVICDLIFGVRPTRALFRGTPTFVGRVREWAWYKLPYTRRPLTFRAQLPDIFSRYKWPILVIACLALLLLALGQWRQRHAHLPGAPHSVLTSQSVDNSVFSLPSLTSTRFFSSVYGRSQERQFYPALLAIFRKDPQLKRYRANLDGSFNTHLPQNAVSRSTQYVDVRASFGLSTPVKMAQFNWPDEQIVLSTISVYSNERFFGSMQMAALGTASRQHFRLSRPLILVSLCAALFVCGAAMFLLTSPSDTTPDSLYYVVISSFLKWVNSNSQAGMMYSDLPDFVQDPMASLGPAPFTALNSVIALTTPVLSTLSHLIPFVLGSGVSLACASLSLLVYTSRLYGRNFVLFARTVVFATFFVRLMLPLLPTIAVGGEKLWNITLTHIKNAP